MTRKIVFTNTGSMFSHSTTTIIHESHNPTTDRFSVSHPSTTNRVDGKNCISSCRIIIVGSSGPSTGTI